MLVYLLLVSFSSVLCIGPLTIHLDIEKFKHVTVPRSSVCAPSFPNSRDVSYTCFEPGENYSFAFENTVPAGFVIDFHSPDGFSVFTTANGTVAMTLMMNNQVVFNSSYETSIDPETNLSCFDRVTVQPVEPLLPYQTWHYGSSKNTFTLIPHARFCISVLTLSIAYYRIQPNVSSVVPTILGNKLEVKAFLEFHAENLQSDERYFCVFSKFSRVPATISGKGTINCTVPMSLLQNTFLTASLQVYTVGKPFIYSSQERIAIVENPSVFRIEPRSGVSGTSVTVFGRDFSLYTRIGFSILKDLTVVSVPVTYYNTSTAITFTAPDAMSFGRGDRHLTVNIVVSVNGIFWDDTPSQFTYIPTESPTVVVPPIDVTSRPTQPPTQPPTQSPTPPTPLTTLEPTAAPTIDSNSDFIRYYLIWILIGGVLLIIVAAMLGLYCWSKKRRDDSDYYPVSMQNMANQGNIDVSEMEIKEKIGRGNFADVYRGVWRHTEVAVKKLVRQENEGHVYEEFLKEATVMLSLRHPNVVNFMGISRNPSLCIITEYLARGTLHDIIFEMGDKIDLEDIRKFSMDSCRGMNYLHSCNLIHRDLKSRNLLIDDSWTVKVCDFGLARTVKDDHAEVFTSCGTPAWTAPEVLRNHPYSFEADVYSFAMVLFELIALKEPFQKIPAHTLIMQVAVEFARPILPPDIDERKFDRYITIMKECWDENPLQRPRFSEVLTSLELLNYEPTLLHLHNTRTSRAKSPFNSPSHSPSLKKYRKLTFEGMSMSVEKLPTPKSTKLDINS